MLRVTLAAFALVLTSVPAVYAVERTRLGYGNLITNDIVDGAADRWRTGSYASSRVWGPTWSGTAPAGFGDLLELRLHGEIIAPENLREHLAAKYGTTLEGSIKARARLTEMGAALGFEFNYADDMWMVNTFRAHQLIDFAEDQGRAHDMKLALFAAFFTRREDLNNVDVLADVAASIGLDRDTARAMLNSEERAQTVREKEQFWTSRGVTGVPAMIFNRQHLVTGAQGEENYAKILKQLQTAQAV